MPDRAPKRSDVYEVPFEVPLLSYDEAVRLAADTGTISGDAGPLLETVIDMLDELERPDEHMVCIQVAGTNGKTSTARFSSAILLGEGVRAALYTSPQLVRYEERMEVAGSVVSREEFAWGVSVAAEAGARVNERRAHEGHAAYVITPFDLLTVAAFAVFARARVEMAVLEVGMGGRWDATSASDPQVVAITGIGLDHTRILGDTLAQIAAEKAAVIRPGRAVVLGEGVHEPSVWQVMDERCQSCAVDPVVSSHELLHAPEYLGDDVVFHCATRFASYRVAMPKPVYQPQNAACAIHIAEELLDRALVPDILERSLRACPTPGRFDVVRTDPLLLIDACHNPQSCEAFVRAVDELEPCIAKRPTLLVAALSDKDVAGILDVLIPAFPRVAVTQTASDRALAADDLAEAVAKVLAASGRSAKDLVAVYATVADALAGFEASGEAVVAAGTITLAGEVAAAARKA